jgi:hypothetical protein
MKKILIVLFVIVSIFASCKKASDQPYYFTFQIGPKQYTVDSGYVTRVTLSQIMINNNYESPTVWFQFLVQNASTDTSMIGTYTDNNTIQPERELQFSKLSIRFPNDANDGEYATGGNNSFSFTITESNNKYVTGTFGGILSGGVVTISNGKFKLPYK